MIHYRDGSFQSGPVRLDVAGEAFKYGFGIFDTLRWNRDHVCRLAAHLARDHASLKTLGIAVPDCDYAQLIPQLALRNGLMDAPGRVNIHFPVEGGSTRPVLTAAPYVPLAAGAVLRLAVSSHPVPTWLAGHKTSNYLGYYLAHRKAQEDGWDGVALLSAGGYVLETATAALVFSTEDAWVAPCAPEAQEAGAAPLPSVALACASEVLPIVRRCVHQRELGDFRHGWALNSLMGMRPLVALGQVRWEPDFGPCGVVDERILRA